MSEKEKVFKNISNTVDEGHCPECLSTNLCMISFDTIQCGDCYQLLGDEEGGICFQFDFRD